MGDKHSQIFGKQVLDVTLDFLYGLLVDGLTVLEGLTDTEVIQDLTQATGNYKLKYRTKTSYAILNARDINFLGLFCYD